jgi:hypothetical protein
MATKLALEMHLLSKKVKEFKTDCIRKHDKWGQNFRAPLLASCLQFSTAREIANSNAVCLGWRLPQHLEDRLVKPRYIEDFTLMDSNHPKIAPSEDSPWRVRYGRRQRVHNNVMSGTFQTTEHKQENDLTLFHGDHRLVHLISYNYGTGTTKLLSAPELKIVNTGELLDSASIHSNANAVFCRQWSRCVLYDIPSLLERERFDDSHLSVGAMKGDYLVFIVRRPGRRAGLAVRSISSKKQLWEIEATDFRNDMAIELSHHLLFLVSGETLFVAGLLDGLVIAKLTLRVSPYWLESTWDGSPQVVVYHWGQHLLQFMRLQSNRLELHRPLHVPDGFDVRMTHSGRFGWQQKVSPNVDWAFRVLDLKTGSSAKIDFEINALIVLQFNGLFALATGCRMIDFTVGLD